MKKRKKYTSGFKTKVVLEALQERETIRRFLTGRASFYQKHREYSKKV